MLDSNEGKAISLGPGDLPASASELLESVACPWLKYVGHTFYCHELYHKKKESVDLGAVIPEIKINCQSCKEGKASQILAQYQRSMRGQNIRGLLQMIKLFETFAEKGVPSTIYFCNRIKNKQVMTGQKEITCTKHDARVPISTCQDPRCPHFEDYSITVVQEFPKEALALIEGIAEDYQRIEDLTPGERKEVKAEQDPQP